MASSRTPDPPAPIESLPTGSPLPDHGATSQACWSVPDGEGARNLAVDHRRGRQSEGLSPNSRHGLGETFSINELAAQRNVDTKNLDIATWLDSNDVTSFPNNQIPFHKHEGISDEPIRLGHDTENRVVSGQLYYAETAAELTTEDRELMHQHGAWMDGPKPFHISQAPGGRNQPESSQAAIERFERLCLDNDSIVSHAATWGTEQRGFRNTPYIVTTAGGNFLRRLSLDENAIRRPSIFETLRGLVRKQDHKRSLSIKEEEQDNIPAEPTANVSGGGLGPQPWTSSRFKPPIPSINTEVATGMNPGSSRRGSQRSGVTVRSGSSGTTLIPSPRSFTGSLKLKNPLTHLRSKSDFPKGPASLTEMWKQVGGPPVPALLKLDNPIQPENDGGVNDMEEQSHGWSQSPIENVTPTFSGFQRYAIMLNPMLESSNTYLVDRISHHLVDRYRDLSAIRAQHSKIVSIGDCPSGTLCIEQEESANPSDAGTGHDICQSSPENGDGSESDFIGYINSESFPHGIPMPPTSKLPAEVECQLCFQTKKFQTPTDWTWHIHEDVQPYFCTWPSCQPLQVFRRKSDWSRHENECHRHTEWYTCDIDHCRHTCHRRGAFARHLVREHNYAEPKFEAKASLRRANDPTWLKVGMCHRWTDKKPDEEPCCFCGKAFPHWKELTVHLARHMEQICLPVLRLLSQKELDADGIISPAQAPPLPVAPPAILTTPASPSVSATEPPPEQLAPDTSGLLLRPHLNTTLDPTYFTQSSNSLAPPGTFPRSPADSNTTHQTSASIFSTPMTFHSPMSSVDSTYGITVRPEECTSGHELKFPLFNNDFNLDGLDHPWDTYKPLPEHDTRAEEKQSALNVNQPSGKSRAINASTQTTESSTYLTFSSNFEEHPMSPGWEYTLPEICKHDTTSSPSPDTSSQCPSQSDSAPSLVKGNGFRKVALAKIRIQLLGLLNSEARTVSEIDNDPESSVEDSYDEESANDDDDAGHAGADSGDSNADTPCHDAAGTNPIHNTAKSKSTLKSRRAGRNDDDEQGSRRKRTRKESPNSHRRLNLRRFACPYQVYEPGHSCLRQGPRNPSGGCNGINRLKQHLNRRHMLSNRCQNCWISFDAKGKAMDHSAEAACNARQMHQEERFMTPEQEEEIERCSMSSEEDTWWWLFRQLIPNMRDRNLDQLKQQYSPYYPSQLPMTIPPINLWGVSFSSGDPLGLSTGSASLVPAALDTATGTPNFSTSINPSLTIPDLSSEVFAVPVYEQDSPQALPPAAPSLVVPRGTGLDMPSSGSSSASNAYSTPASSAPTHSFLNSSAYGAPPSRLLAEPSQWRRAYDRLQTRYAVLESENIELRDAGRTNRTNLNSAISLLDGILTAEGDVALSSGLYERLEGLSDVLVDLQKRLK